MVQFRRMPPEGDTRRPATITPAARGWPWRQTPSPATGWRALYGRRLRGWKTGSGKGDVADLAGEFCDNRTIIPRIASTASRPSGARVHHEGHNGFTKDTTGPAGPRLPSGRRHGSELRARARGGRRRARSRRVLRAFFVFAVMNPRTAEQRVGPAIRPGRGRRPGGRLARFGDGVGRAARVDYTDVISTVLHRLARRLRSPRLFQKTDGYPCASDCCSLPWRAFP